MMLQGKKSTGFTLIELVVVVGLVALLLVGVSNLFMTTLRGGGRVQEQSDLKDEGEYALITMERLIRGGDNVRSCGGSIIIDYPDGVTEYRFRRYGTDNVIQRSDDQGVSWSNVTAKSVEVTSLSFNCVYNNDGIRPDVVTIDFEVDTPGLNPNTYHSVVTQRNASSK